MRTFIISTVIFILLIAVITINFIYINRVSDRLTDLADAAASDITDENLSELESYWNKNIGKISLSVNFTSINGVSSRIASIRALFEANDPFIHREFALLKEDIREIRLLEQFSALNIF